jgi:hypothetical protein
MTVDRSASLATLLRTARHRAAAIAGLVALADRVMGMVHHHTNGKQVGLCTGYVGGSSARLAV